MQLWPIVNPCAKAIPCRLASKGYILLQATLVSELLRVNDVIEGRCRTDPTLSDELRQQLDHEADQLRRFSN
jgi:hypothetical protein